MAVCDRPGCNFFLSFTGWSVHRGAVFFLKDDQKETKYVCLSIPLGRCAQGHRIRILPSGLLPGKTYALEIFATIHDSFLNQPVYSLRISVAEIHGEPPHFSTLHRSLSGFGHFLKGWPTRSPPDIPTPSPSSEQKKDLTPTPVLPPPESTLAPPVLTPASPQSLPPTAANLIAFSEKNWGKNLQSIFLTFITFLGRKFRSEKRREILTITAQALKAAKELFPDKALPLTVWQDRLVAAGLSPGFFYFTPFPVTSIQQHESTGQHAHTLAVREKTAQKGETGDSRAPP